MKYLKSLLVLPFLVALNVYAADECTYKEQANLNKLAALVDANYEVIQDEEKVTAEDPDGLGTVETTVKTTTFKIKIYNITENLSLKISEKIGNKSGQERTVNYSNTDNGVYTFTSDNIGDIIEYKIKINASGGACSGKTIRTMSFKKPRVNPYAGYEMCKGHEDVQYCEEFTTKEFEFTDAKLEELISSVDPVKDDKPDEENKFLRFLKDNYIYIIAGTVLIAGGVGAYFIYRRKRVL